MMFNIVQRYIFDAICILNDLDVFVVCFLLFLKVSIFLSVRVNFMEGLIWSNVSPANSGSESTIPLEVLHDFVLRFHGFMASCI